VERQISYLQIIFERSTVYYLWDIMYSRDDLWMSIGYRVLLG
jgi:hypothetical protein